mmetsp:Transcript_21579/g.66885  ORF Transcript_21579/g.66885 Transcript_21579/m.66885 type:complete len:345 (-) Transcript_21579:45-1079(-)
MLATRRGPRWLSSALQRLRGEAFGPSNLDLQELDVGLYAADPARLLVPAGQRGRVYGGQVVGQALHAATLTAPPDRCVHSVHAYFLKAGRTDRPIIYHVENTSDGRSFSTRRVLARQAGATIFQCQASFQVAEESDLQHAPSMPDVRPPDESPGAEDVLAGLRSDPRVAGASPEATLARQALEATERFMASNPIEVRYAASVPDFLDPDPQPRPARSAVWMKTRLPLEDAPNLHLCAAAFFSDWTLLTTSLLPHRIVAPGFSSMLKLSLLASLDHAVWFHRPFRADEWVLYSVESPHAAGGRTLTLGQIYSRDGAHCASVAQEGVVRRRREGDSRCSLPLGAFE